MPIRRRRPSERAAGSRVHALFEAHGGMVYGLCRVILRDPADAEDATQQTFLLAFRALLNGHEPRADRAWLATIARNESLGRLRHADGAPRFVPEDADLPSLHDTASVAEGNAVRDSMLEAVAQLPAPQRDAFVLRELFGLSYEEIAAALGVTRPAVESLLFRARQTLQADLQPLRTAFAGLVAPLAVQQSLAALTATGGGGGVLAALGAAPTAAKVAAAAVALGSAGTATGVEVARHPHHRPAPEPSRTAPPTAARAGAVLPAAKTRTFRASSPVPTTPTLAETALPPIMDETVELPTESVDTLEALTTPSEELPTESAGEETVELDVTTVEEPPPPGEGDVTTP
jgi:RNA polymerase sigma factor (sigma-70 family)